MYSLNDCTELLANEPRVAIIPAERPAVYKRPLNAFEEPFGAGAVGSTGIISTDVQRAAELLRAGGVVAFPTETVYGLGAVCQNQRAVARVFEVKGRPRIDPLIVHLAEPDDVMLVVQAWPDQAARLARRFWPGPLTLVLPKRDLVPDLVTAGLPTVAVRVPDHAMARALIRQAGAPLVAPSANRFGQVSPTTARHVVDQLDEQIDLVLDGGPCRVGVESTVVQITETGALVLRPGGTTLEELQAEIGPLRQAGPLPPESGGAMPAPGLLPRHYAPRTPLVLCPSAVPTRLELERFLQSARPNAHRVGLLSLLPVDGTAQIVAQEVLSPAGDLREAAANFFAALRRLDSAGLELIVAAPFPDAGLGRALNDRLQRAAKSA